MTSNVQRYMLLDSTKFPKVFIENFNEGLTPYTYTGNTPQSNYFEITQTIQGNTLYQKGSLSAGNIRPVLQRTLNFTGAVNRITFDFQVDAATDYGDVIDSKIEFRSADNSRVTFYPNSADRNGGASTPGAWVGRVVANGTENAAFLSNFLPKNTLYKVEIFFNPAVNRIEFTLKDSSNSQIAFTTLPMDAGKKQYNTLLFTHSAAVSRLTYFGYWDNIVVEYE